MREGWKRIRLGDVFDVSTAKLGAHSEEPAVFAISKYDGVVLSGDYHDRRVASAKLDGYKILNADAWAYSTIHIDEGSIARNNHGFAGVVSPMYTILHWVSEDCVPAYFEHLLRTPEMLSTYKDMAQGSINRRCSLPWKSFSAIEVDVPPLEEQQRIVDLIGSLDDAISATDASADAARLATSELRADHFEGTRGDWESIEALADVIIGKQKNVKGDTQPPVPYLRAANLSGGRLDLEDISNMPFTATERLRMGVAAGDVLIVEGGGGYGHSAMWPGPEHPFVGIQNSVLRLRAYEDKAIPEYLLHWSKWAKESGYFDDSMTSTTIPHLSLARVKAMTVPAVSVADQRRIVSAMDAAASFADSTEAFASALRETRSELLTVLLSGEHEIPESYDSDTAVQLAPAA